MAFGISDALSQNGWQQTVARHREEDARLAELEDEQHAAHRGHCAERDDEPREVEQAGGPWAYCSAVIIGSGVPSCFQGAMPVITMDSAMYSTVQMIRLMMIPNGMSLRGILRLLGGGRDGVESDVG